MIEDKRKVLAVVVALAACLLLMCSEKDGSMSPGFKTEPPQYIIEYVTPSPAKIEPNGQGTISARVVDRDLEPVEGKVVEFAATKGTIGEEDTTDADGIAGVDYTAPSEAGYVEVSAFTAGAVGKSAYLQIGEGALEFGSAALIADGITYGTLTLTVTDEQGDPVEGASVSFSTDHGYIADADNATNATGEATAKLVSEVSTVDLSATVMATITYGGAEYTEIAMVSMLGVTLSVAADPMENPADGVSTSTVRASLKLTTTDSPLAGYQVLFSTSIGSIGASAYTNSGGTATSTLTSPTTPGTAQVVARYGGHSDIVEVSFGELTLTIAPGLPRMVADGLTYQAVFATLLTEDNNPVVGANISFSTTHGIITRIATTNMWGDAVAFLTSAAYPATATVRASFEAKSAQTAVTFEVPVISLTATPLSVVAQPASQAMISAYVSFYDGEPVPDSTYVTFRTTEGTIEPYEFTSSGIIYIPLRSAGVASNDVVVEAACGGATASTNLVFMPDIPARVFAYASPDTIPGDGNSYATVAAEVTDAYGNLVKDGTTVYFSLMSGSGIMAPSAVTASGVATVKFLPTGGGNTATIRATSNGYFYDVGIFLLADAPGAIHAAADSGWIAVGGTYGESQTIITAQVTDGNMNPVEDGTEVVFEIISGPGGGEYLDNPSYGAGPVAKNTVGGGATAVLNAGTLPGTVLMEVSSGDVITTGVAVGISAGPPDAILINTGDVARNNDGTYTIGVAAIVRDEFNNPVEDGTSIYFTLDQPDIGFINPEAPTGNVFPCVELTAVAIKGVARACLTYPTDSIFELCTIRASTAGGDVESNFSRGLPIMSPTMSIEVSPGSISGSTGGSALIYVTVWDSYMLNVDKAYVSFSVEGDGYVSPTSVITDESGQGITTFYVNPGTGEGTSTIKAHLWMTDVQAEFPITITE